MNIKAKYKNIIKLVLIAFTITRTESANANTELKSQQAKAYDHSAIEFEHNPYAKIITNIGAKSQTRISFKPYYITEVVGDSNKYKLISGMHASSIFILPKVKAGETIDLTIITNNGRAQDLSLNIDAGSGKTIYIKEDITSKSEAINKLLEAKHMIKVMARGGNGRYAVTDFTLQGKNKGVLISATNKTDFNHHVDNVTTNIHEDLEIRETKLYSYSLYKLKGLVISIKNNGKSTINFDEHVLSKMFAGSLMVSTSSSGNKDIKPSKTIKAYVVIEEGIEE